MERPAEKKTNLCYRPEFCPDLATNFPDLARIIRGNWDSFVDLLADCPDEKLVRFIDAVGQSEEHAAAAQDLLRIIPGAEDAEYKLIQMQVLLDPMVAPEFRGLSLDNESLGRNIAKAEEGDTVAAEWINAIVDVHVFGAMSEVLGSSNLARVDYFLSRWVPQVDEALSLIPEEREEWKNVCRAVERSAKAVLTECAISLEAPGQSGVVDSVIEKAKGLSVASYGKEEQAVAPLVGMLASAKADDLGRLLVLNAVLAEVQRAESERCNSVYESAREAIFARRYNAAIEQLETIRFLEGVDELYEFAEKALEGAEREYARAMREAESRHFESARGLFLDLKEYKDSSEMVDVVRKAAELTENMQNPERAVEREINGINDEISRNKSRLVSLGRQLSAEMVELSNIEERIAGAEAVLDSLCVDRGGDLVPLLATRMADLDGAKELLRVKTMKKQSLLDLRTEDEASLKSTLESLQSARDEFGQAQVKLTTLQRKKEKEEEETAEKKAQEATALALVEAKEAALESLREELSALEAERARLIKPFGSKRQAMVLRSKIELLQREREETRAGHSRAMAALGCLSQQLAKTLVSYGQVKNEIWQLEKRKEALEAQEGLLRTRAVTNGEALKHAKKDLQETKESLSALEEEVAELRVEMAELKASIRKENPGGLNDILLEKGRQQEKVKSLEEDVEAASAAILELEEQKRRAIKELKRASKKKATIDPVTSISYCRIFDCTDRRSYYRYKGISKAIRRGSVIRLGRYDQKQLEWSVLKAEKGKALLFGPTLGDMELDESRCAKTWDECSLYHWLNRDFFIQAFDEFEQEAVRFGGKEFGFCVSVPTGNEVRDMNRSSAWQKRGAPWWTANLVPCVATSDFRTYLRDYGKRYLQEKHPGLKRKISEICQDDADGFLNKLLSPDSLYSPFWRKTDTVQGLFGGFGRGALERFGRGSQGKDSLRALEDSLRVFDRIEDYLWELDEALDKIKVDAVRDYDGKICNRFSAITVQNGVMSSAPSVLGGKAAVRPMIWVPYDSSQE